MWYKLSSLCFILTILLGCSASERPQAYRHHSAICAIIKNDLTKTYPPQLQTRLTATRQAELLQDYQNYQCEREHAQ